MNRLDEDQCQLEQNRFLNNFVLVDMEDDQRLAHHLYHDIREYLSKRLEVLQSVRLISFDFVIFVCCFIE